jgi:hypothetical protein
VNVRQGLRLVATGACADTRCSSENEFPLFHKLLIYLLGGTGIEAAAVPPKPTFLQRLSRANHVSPSLVERSGRAANLAVASDACLALSQARHNACAKRIVNQKSIYIM